MATLDQNLQQGMEGLPVGPNPANLESQRFPSAVVQMGQETPPVLQQAPGTNIIRAGTVIELPYHTNSSGQPIQIQLDKDTSQEELQREIDAQFPRTAQAVALQMMAKGADPVSKEDYDFVKEQSKLMEKARGFRSEGEQNMLGALADAIPGAISGLLEGVGATAKAGLGVINSFDTNRNRIAAAGTILEGLIQGTERLGGIGSMLGSLITMDDYGAYKSLKDFERIEASRQAGDTAVLSLSPENAKQANKISQFLDATVLLPVAGKAVGFAGRVAGEQAIKQLAEQSSVGLIRKGIGKAMETTGALGTQLVDLSANIAAEQLGKETILGSVAKGAGGVAKLKPQALEWAGKLIGSEAASETLAQGIRAAQEAGRSGVALRAVAKVLPPDSVLRSAGAVADSVLNGAALGAGISGVQAASDPFNTKLDVAEQMTVGGITGGALGGVLGVIPGAAELTPAARNRRFVAEMAKDISERPETRSFVFDGVEYATNDATNRVKLLSNDNMSATDKARIFAVTKSAEFAGHDVGYIDNATVLPDSLGGKGENIRGVKAVSDNGRTTLLINVDQINPASAVEEVAHAFIGREAGREIINDLIKNRGGVSQALEPLVDLGRRYLTALQETSPEAATQFSRLLAVAEDVNQPPAARQTAATLLAEEWAAMGVGEILSGADPKILETGRGTVSIWDSMRKGLVDTFAGLMTRPSAASKDPITGFFYKDGRLIKDPVLETTAKRLQDSILRGQNFFPQDLPQYSGRQRTQQATAADVGVNVGDTMVNGAQVIDIIPRPRYEDTHAQDQQSGAKAGSATKPRTTKKETGQDTYHKFVFDQVAQVAGESVVDPGLVQSGVYFGNLTEVPAGSPIVYTKAFTEPQLQQLFQVQTHHNRPLIAPEARDAVARFNEASKNSQLVVVDYDMNIGKGKTGREYAGRVQQVVLPLGIQQTPKGGPIAGVFNMSLLNDIVNYQRSLKGMEKVDAAFRDFGIKSLEDLIPVVKAHVENYSSPNAVPGVTLLQGLRPGVSKESATVLRDLMHISNGIEPRKAFPSDVLVNPQQFQGIMPAPQRQVTAYDITGRPRPGARLYRDRAVFSDLRLDSLHNVQLYAGRDGLPVKVDVNLEQFVPKQRSNFSPRRSINEQIGETQVVTDQDTGRRAFILKDGRAKVFNSDGSLKGVYDSLLDAQIALNKADIRFSASRIGSEIWDYPEQKISSAATSINETKLPETFKRVAFVPGSINADIGGGRFDNATAKLAESNVQNVIYDPFNRTREWNKNAIAKIANGKSDTATVNNVLNVIQEPASRQRVIAQAADAVRQDGKAYFLIYEGDQSGNSRVTKQKDGVALSWQEHRKADSYIPEVQQHFRNVQRSGNLLIATDPIKQESAQGGVRFSPRSPAAVRRAAEQAQALRSKMETELPSRLMGTWLSELAASKAPTERATPAKAKGKTGVSLAEQAQIEAASRQARGIESRFPQLEQVTLSQREQFMRDAMEAERGIAAQALARIASQRRQGSPSVLRAASAGQLSEGEMARMNAAIERKKAQDYPVLDPDEVRTLFKERRRRPQAALEAAAMQEVQPFEVSPVYLQREAPKGTAPGVYKGFEALSDVGLKREPAAQPQKIKPRATDLLAEEQARANLQEILRVVAEKAAKQPKREPVVIDVPKAEIPKIEPPVEPIVTPAEEPRLPSNMIIARAPRGMFKLYSLTQQGKAVQEALSESYGDALQKAQRKYFLKNKMKEDQAFLKSQRYAP